ncbi:4555_t:CDS:2, partial [Racocetra fulgida]
NEKSSEEVNNFWKSFDKESYNDIQDEIQDLEERTYYSNDRTTPPCEESQGDLIAPPREERQDDRTMPLREENQGDRTTPLREESQGDHIERKVCKQGKSVSREEERTYYLDSYTTPPPQAGLLSRYVSTPTCSVLIESPETHARMGNNIFTNNYYDNDRVIIDDVENLYFQDGDPINDYKCELKLREAIKKCDKSREHAQDWLLKELLNDQKLKKNLGSVILRGLETLPNDKIKNDPSETTLVTNYLDYIIRGIFHNPNKHIVQWPNTALNESKLRKYKGRAKQPDFVISIIHQLQIAATIFVGEVSPPSQKNNVYKNCSDLIRLGIFMKDCMDSAIDKGADGTYFMIHIAQVSIPTSIKEILPFVDEIGTLLNIKEIFIKSVDTLYSKLCNPSIPSEKAIYKRNTLETPKFNKI